MLVRTEFGRDLLDALAPRALRARAPLRGRRGLGRLRPRGLMRAERREWEELAELDPLWAVLSEPDRKGGRWDLDAFLATGEVEVERDARARRRARPAGTARPRARLRLRGRAHHPRARGPVRRGRRPRRVADDGRARAPDQRGRRERVLSRGVAGGARAGLVRPRVVGARPPAPRAGRGGAGDRAPGRARPTRRRGGLPAPARDPAAAPAPALPARLPAAARARPERRRRSTGTRR